MADQEHVIRLLEGVEGWNQWREENPEIRPDLSRANFSGADLERANLSGADLSEANLRGAFLGGANLERANLERANLSNTFLIGAHLEGAHLSGADLGGADLSGAHLEGAFLSGANLERANLSDAGLEGAHLSGVDLRSAVVNTSSSSQEAVRILSGEDSLDSFDDYLSLAEPDLVHQIVRSLGIDEEPKQFSAFCYVHAEMDERVIVNRPTSVEIVISKEQLEQSTSKASQSGTVELESDRWLIVQVVPKTNFVSEGNDRVEVDPPKESKPQTLYFDLRATHLGDGEVWVVLRQAQQALLTLVLRPQIVENRAALRTMAAPMQFLAAPSSTQSPAGSSSQKLRVSDSVTDLPTPSAPLHQLRIIERRNGSQITYLYELNSPLWGVLSLHESKPINSDRLEYVESLYKELESRWASTQGEKEDFAAELRAFGGQLFDQLFPEPLKQQLWDHRAQLDNIMVLSTEPFIPWELVHLKPPGQNYLPNEAYFLGQMGLVRWLHDVGFPPETLQIRLGKAHYIIPHYPDPRYHLPQAEQEAPFLEQHFGATEVEAQPGQVRQTLMISEFDLLHFAGHGLSAQDNIAHAKLMLEGRLERWLEGDTEKSHYVPAQLSATTVEQYCNCNGRDRHERPMVVLNACQIGRESYCLTGVGGFAHAFLKGGAGVFVGTLWSVGDRPARLFTETLYASLLEGNTLSESTTAARHAAQQAGDSTWLAYVVYGHPHLKLRIFND